MLPKSKSCSNENSLCAGLQNTLEDLMAQVVFVLQLVDAKGKKTSIPVVFRKELKDCMHAVLRTITKFIIPSAYFQGIIKLLGHADKSIAKKVLLHSLIFVRKV